MPPQLLLLLLLSVQPSLPLAVSALSAKNGGCRFVVNEEQVPVNAAISGPNLYSCLGGPEGLRAESGDDLQLQSPEWPMVTDSDRTGKQVWQLLKVGSNGSLHVASLIDREEPSLRCFNQAICSKPFSIVLQNTRLNRMLRQLSVLDIHDYNDNSPVFGRENRELNVFENQSPMLNLPSVSDADAGRNGQTMTRIVSHDAAVPRSDSLINPNSRDPLLQISPALDYEKVTGYNITLEACDNGNVATPCTRIQVRISVIDANDNAPHFVQREFVLPELAEDAFEKAGGGPLTIGKLEASDPDGGDNGRIEFSIIQGEGSDAFAVGPQTGQLLQVAKVNAAELPNVSLTVQARDFGKPSRLTDTATVRIRLVDVNDHSPTVSIIGSQEPRLVEGRANPNFAYIFASDRDLGEFGRVSCSLDADSASRFVLQQINQMGSSGVKQFSISTGPGLIYDREQQASDTVAIVCWDHGSPARTGSLTLTVSIEDVNEFPPVFSDTVEYSFRVAENQTEGELVGTMTAYDKDATASIAYSISDDYMAVGCFVINSTTGQIRTKRRLDREDADLARSGRPVYVITVQATDGRNSTTAKVNIRILDVNDNPPLLNAVAAAGLSVNESFGGESFHPRFVGQLAYTDADEPDTANSRASFSLVHTLRSTPELRFLVSPDGRVSARGILDREASPRHLLVVRLTDQGNPPLSSTGTATVRLLDLNDNRPSIWTPRPRQQFNLTEDSPPGISFATVNITDADAECERLSSLDCLRAGGLTLRLERQAATLFSVNSTSGQLMVANPLTQGLHRLNLTATDRGYPQPLTSWVEFSVLVSPRADRSNHLLGGLLGSANNWTVLLVIVVASSFITVILVVAIVLLNRRQPCLVGSGGSSGRSSGDSDDVVNGNGIGDKDFHAGRRDCPLGGGLVMDGTMRSQQLPPPPPPAPLSPMIVMYGQQQQQQLYCSMRRENGGGAAYHLIPQAAPPAHYGSNALPWPLGLGDYDGASADSGHGASEEDMHGEHASRFMSLGHQPGGSLQPRSPGGFGGYPSITEEDLMLPPPPHHQHHQQQQQQHEHIPLTKTGAACSTFGRQQQQQHHAALYQPQPPQAALMLCEEPQFQNVTLGRSPNRLTPIVGSRSATPQQQLHSFGASPPSSSTGAVGGPKTAAV